MQKHIVAISSNGRRVYAPLMTPPLSLSVSRNPNLLGLVKEAISQLELSKNNRTIEHDMGRSIGYGDVLSTKESDVVFYARKLGEDTYTKFVKNRSTDATQYLTLELSQDEDGDYALRNVWIGRAYPPAPDNKAATPRSKKYWKSHAVAYNGQAVVSSTITKDCPY